jgi:DUF218 domain
MRRRLPIFIFMVVVLALVFAHQAAHLLVVDQPAKSDAIVVLAGETSLRPIHAVELLRQGMAPHVFMNAETRVLVYDQELTDIAQKYINTLPEANRISVCPIIGFSTAAEATDVGRCLQSWDAHQGVHTILIVTSDFHTRRALLIFRNRLPQYEFSTAAARAPGSFGDAWWTNREWAKSTLDEWLKILWFEGVDRWRG